VNVFGFARHQIKFRGDIYHIQGYGTAKTSTQRGLKSDPSGLRRRSQKTSFIDLNTYLENAAQCLNRSMQHLKVAYSL
jgi:hypothetical protein